MARKLLDLLFWLAASVYFGGILALGALVAPAIFDTTKAQHINLPGIPSPPLDPATQAGGEIFGVILQRFWYVEMGALGAILVAVIGWLYLERMGRAGTWALAVIWFTVAGLFAYDTLSLTPEVFRVRQAVRDTATAHAGDAPGAPWPERQAFDALHQRSEARAHLKAFMLLALIGVAAWRGATPPKANPEK